MWPLPLEWTRHVPLTRNVSDRLRTRTGSDNSASDAGDGTIRTEAVDADDRGVGTG